MFRQSWSHLEAVTENANKHFNQKCLRTLALPFLLYGSKTWTIKAKDARRITAAEMKYMRRTAGNTWTDYKTNTQIAKELKITPILDKLLEYKRNWIQHVNRMPRNRLPRVMKRYSLTGRRNHGRPLKRLLDTWDWNGSTSGPTPWQIYDDDDDDECLRTNVIPNFAKIKILNTSPTSKFTRQKASFVIPFNP